MLSRDEIQMLYTQGSEAVVTLVEQLQQQMALLTARVNTLEQRLKQDSHNSHQPPSTAILNLDLGKTANRLRLLPHLA